MEKTDEELMLDYQRGETMALRELFERHKTRVFNFALRFLNNRADAEDVAGDAFLAVAQKSALYAPTAQFSTWLFTIARNLSVSKLRTRKRRKFFWQGQEETHDPVEDLAADGPSPAQALERGEMERHVQKAVSVLPSLQKQALILREYHDMSYEEIRQVLDCPLSTVKILIFRARETLRKTLSPILKEMRP